MVKIEKSKMIDWRRQSRSQQKINLGLESTGKSCIATKDVAVRVCDAVRNDR